MSSPFIMIDGYNLMHAVGLARQSYGPGDLELCRNRLLQQLTNRLNPRAAERTTVVFDAFGADDNSGRRQTRYGVDLIFAPAGTDADSELERLVAAHSSPGRLLVVSSDRRIQRAARRRRARSIDSDRFWAGLDPESAPALRRNDRGRAITETDDWLTEFAGLDTIYDDSLPPVDGVFDADYLSDLESEFGGS